MYAAVTAELAENFKASDGARCHGGPHAEAPPAVPTKTECKRERLPVKAPPSGSAIIMPSAPKLPLMELRNLAGNRQLHLRLQKAMI